MSRKRKASAEQPAEKREAKVESVITFQEFFCGMVNQKKINSWQEREIHAFFRELGLTDKEPEDRYKDALAKY